MPASARAWILANHQKSPPTRGRPAGSTRRRPVPSVVPESFGVGGVGHVEGRLAGVVDGVGAFEVDRCGRVPAGAVALPGGPRAARPCFDTELGASAYQWTCTTVVRRTGGRGHTRTQHDRRRAGDSTERRPGARRGGLRSGASRRRAGGRDSAPGIRARRHGPRARGCGAQAAQERPTAEGGMMGD